MITNNIIYNTVFLYTYNYIHTIILYNKTSIIILCSNNKNNFGIGRFITNQQNIYRVTPVHYLQKAEKKT